MARKGILSMGHVPICFELCAILSSDIGAFVQQLFQAIPTAHPFLQSAPVTPECCAVHAAILTIASKAGCPCSSILSNLPSIMIGLFNGTLPLEAQDEGDSTEKLEAAPIPSLELSAAITLAQVIALFSHCLPLLPRSGQSSWEVAGDECEQVTDSPPSFRGWTQSTTACA
jgi:hypothetical protein